MVFWIFWKIVVLLATTLCYHVMINWSVRKMNEVGQRSILIKKKNQRLKVYSIFKWAEPPAYKLEV